MPPAPLSPHPSRLSDVGGLPIHRALPVPGRRRIGAWCFLDRFGPLSLDPDRSFDVGAHPHTGIQTVSYLMSGEVLHRDSLGYEARVRPGSVNIMTAGRGIAHAEEAPRDLHARLHGVQLWVALPEARRHDAPAFQHIPETPMLERRGGRARVFAGQLGETRAAGLHYSPLVGADISIEAGSTIELPLDDTFEHGVLVLSGRVEADGAPLDPDTLYAASPGWTSIELTSHEGARVLLLGGPPFPEPILMWWNFVARDMTEIGAARDAWERREIGEVRGHPGPRIEAPPLLPGSERLRPS